MDDGVSRPPTVVGLISASLASERRFVGDWVVTVTCPYCGEAHTHAAPLGATRSPGFRIAHCRLDRQGYTIFLCSDKINPAAES